MSRNAWIIFILTCVALLSGLVYLSNKDKVKTDVTTIDANSILAASEASGNIADHVQGNPDSKVVVIEYADFQCPGCASAHPRIQAIIDEYKDRVAFVFRVYPLTTIHPNALASAAVAEAAGLQGKYTEMADLLFTNQSEWESLSASERDVVFLNYASQLELDEEKYKTDISSQPVSQKISFNQSLAKKQNLTGTPSFFLNGTEWTQDVWSSDDAIKSALDARIKEVSEN